MRRFIYNAFFTILIVLFFTILLILIFNKPTYYSYDKFTNMYNSKYDQSDYSNEELEGSIFTHNLVMSTLLHSNEFLNGSSINIKKDAFTQTINNDIDFDKYIRDIQYMEPKEATVNKQFIETYESNMYYEGYLEDNTRVRGNLSTYKENDEYILIISFVDENDEFDLNKLKLLSDDSVAEKVVYDIISNMQYEYKTNMTPDIASEYFFKGSIEEVAGSISYHAAIAQYIFENNLDKEVTLKRIRQVNISTVDFDSFIVNRTY